MKKLLSILSFTFILVACTDENIDKEHLAYVEDLGWTIKSFNSSEKILIDEIPPEILEGDRAANITFKEQYIGKELTVTSYQLNEKDLEGKNYRADIYEYNGEIVGSIGHSSAYPGAFNLADKKGVEESYKEIQKKEKEIYGEKGIDWNENQPQVMVMSQIMITITKNRLCQSYSFFEKTFYIPLKFVFTKQRIKAVVKRDIPLSLLPLSSENCYFHT